MDEKQVTVSRSTGGQKRKASPTSPSPMKKNLKRRIMQNFVLIWLDPNIIDKTDENFQNSITHLRRIVNTIEIFSDADQCVDFLTTITEEKAFIIVSNALKKRIVPLIHDISHLVAIFVLCGSELYHAQWAKDWPKVKDNFTHMDLVCDVLQQAARQCEQNSTPISFVPASTPSSSSSNPNLDQLDQSFMYTQLFKEILLEIDEDDIKPLQEFVAYCREQYADNPSQLRRITQFERDFYHHNAIWWYTFEYFIYGMLNRSLRIFEIDIILKLGFFIRRLYRNIEQLHQAQSDRHSSLIKVYRGQGLSKEDFEKLMQTRGGLISFNNFLSTSIDRDVSFAFAASNGDDANLTGVLFEITIDPTLSTTPFALLDNVSYHSAEQEVLFSMHAVFRIGDIEQIDDNNRLWQVKLTITADNDPQLTALTKRMREETLEGCTGWYRLGELLYRLGQFDKAEEVYNVLFDQESDADKTGPHYNQLGRIKYSQGEYQQAIAFYEKSLELYQKTLSVSHLDLVNPLLNIGLVYFNIAEYSKALSSYQKALKILEKCLPSNHPDFAISFNSIENVYCKLGEYAKAISYYEKALEISEQNLPRNHPNLAIFYNNIGSVYGTLGEYSKALSFYEKALEIKKKSLPSNHPDLPNSYESIGLVYYAMGEYPNALSSYEKALEIYQKSLRPNHPDLATSYNNIGNVYGKMDEYPKAIYFYEKTLGIYQKSLPVNHPDLAAFYNNVGLVYDAMGEYLKSLTSHEKALEIRQKSLPPNHPDLASSYNSLGLLYENMGEYSKSLCSHQKALEIREKCLPPNHSDLGMSYNNIGLAYEHIGESSKAISSLEKALDIFRKSLPVNHPDLAISYNNIGDIYVNIGEYSKALSFYEKALEIKQKNLVPNHVDLATLYNSIGVVYSNMNDYSKAMSYYELAVEIGRCSLPEDHPDIQGWRNNLEAVKNKL